MTSGLKTIIYPVKDLDRAKKAFTGLFGAEPYVDQPYYVAFNAGGQDVGLDPNGHNSGLTGPTPFWFVDDIKQSLAQLFEGGAKEVQAVKDVGGGNLTATARDADGNLIGLIQSA